MEADQNQVNELGKHTRSEGRVRKQKPSDTFFFFLSIKGQFLAIKGRLSIIVRRVAADFR